MAMPPPKEGVPVVPRTLPAAVQGLKAPQQQVSSGSRKKVALAPGHSQLDWNRRALSGEDMKGVSGPIPVLTMAEVKKHNKRDDCWMVLDKGVYNVTPYMDYHPGGVDELMRAAGDDGTGLFNEIHKWVTYKVILQGCYLGPLVPDVFKVPPPVRTALSDNFASFRVLSVSSCGEGSILLRFDLPASTHLGLRTGQHLVVQAQTGGETVTRQYTPVSLPSQLGYFELAVKVYPEGKVSKYLGSLKVGDEVQMRGPQGALRYFSPCALDLGTGPKQISWLALIGGGSGITPLFQMALSILVKTQDNLMISILSCNTTIESVMLRPELEDLAKQYKSRLTVRFAITSQPRPPFGCEDVVETLYQKADSDLIKAVLPPSLSSPPGNVLWCGPPGFCDMVRAAVAHLGLDDSMGFQF
mmetsp:Transcript_8487/g.19525  ORF Transcript_8487/g.19525 Transcript_8487/m.19525 type:complete len:413 (+) Transcript_8487:41-1279(+)